MVRHAGFPESGFLGRPWHRLLMAFDEPAAQQAVEWLADHGYAGDAVWELAGLDGRRALDTTGGLEGLLRGRAMVLLRRVLTNDIEYLETLRDELDAGAVILAVQTADRSAADGLARTLGALGARELAYFGSWNFDPVQAQAA